MVLLLVGVTEKETDAALPQRPWESRCCRNRSPEAARFQPCTGDGVSALRRFGVAGLGPTSNNALGNSENTRDSSSRNPLIAELLRHSIAI
jgi:hypothetical protein